MNEPAVGYGNQRQYVSKVLPAADARQAEVEEQLREAFSQFIELRKVEVIVFEAMSAEHLAKSFREHPLVLKPLLAACNLAGRALKRDLKIDNPPASSSRLTGSDTRVLNTSPTTGVNLTSPPDNTCASGESALVRQTAPRPLVNVN